MVRRVFYIALTGALCAVLLTACSSGNKSSTSNGTTAAPVAAPPASNVSGAGDAAHGKTIFMQNCASCHGATAQGGVGPSLKNEKARKNLTQATAWIKHPQPPMPKLYPSPLSEKDVRDVAAYVESL
ncbi:MAG: cytochrome c [Candidatus Eremiobacteraeota bacterium]|nr:cytochrome c [Candidatus Eremiobacteraeota bacterium]MBV9973292.1 cytochrome c [Candidatus Eremiobacteraeota bacterium]